MKTIRDLTAALLNAATQAANGKADTEQCAVLCQCTDTLIRLARLELDARNWAAAEKPIVLEWIDEKQPAQIEDAKSPAASGNRVADLEREIARAQLEIGNHGTSATRKAVLQDKLQQWQDRVRFLKSTVGKGVG